MTKEQEMWFWLCAIPELYWQDIRKLLTYFETPAAVFWASEQELSDFDAVSKSRLKDKILQMRKNWDGEKQKHVLEEKGIRFISKIQEDYPQRLLQICDPPWGLFVKGRLPDDDRPSAAIVGARQCSAYGRHWAREIAGELAAAGVQIVSGMARGIDGEAQKAAAACGGESYAVLGSGVDLCYPRENRGLYQMLPEHGGILSEYVPGTPPASWHFPVRNRLISGLADLVIVIEAKEKSGSLITADMALEQGKDVVAVPGRPEDVLSRGCNRLIEEGAAIFMSADRLKERFGLETGACEKTKKVNIVLETEEKLVYSVLEFLPQNLQHITDRTGLTPKDAGAALVRLILYGMAEETAKNYYAKT